MKTLLVLTGPTGTGKTALALQLAQRFQTPVLNCDSRQLYRAIPIGTAAPTAEELQAAEHYFVGTLGLNDYYSAALYEEEALRVLTSLFARGDVALLSGGSMLYMDAVCKGIDAIPTVSDEVRRRLKERLECEGLDTLLSELRLLDPTHYQTVDRRNPKRIVHALEVCYESGRPYSSFLRKAQTERPFRIVKIGLARERDDLYERINRRVDAMLAAGWLAEARRVWPYRACNSLNTVGYKELFAYLDGTWTLEFALEKIRRNTRVYARKQLTWLRRDEEIHWFHPDRTDEIRAFIDSLFLHR